MKKRFGFTLAEVLITLGIIGVVAAMTIPTLIANTNSAKFRSQFKKSISTMNQAGLMAEAQYDFNYGAAEDACTALSDIPADSLKTFCAIMNGTLTGHTMTETSPYEKAPSFKALPTATTGIPSPVYLSLADGSMVVFSKAAKTTASDGSCTLPIGQTMTKAWIDKHTNCLGFIDVNGKTLPNTEVTCSEAGSASGSAANKAVLDPSAACKVANDTAHMTDIYPIVFHDATVEPASDAAKAVLATAK